VSSLFRLLQMLGLKDKKAIKNNHMLPCEVLQMLFLFIRENAIEIKITAEDCKG
jgi:hypothetical protein